MDNSVAKTQQWRTDGTHVLHELHQLHELTAYIWHGAETVADPEGAMAPWAPTRALTGPLSEPIWALEDNGPYYGP